jgi:hypothetical protein
MAVCTTNADPPVAPAEDTAAGGTSSGGVIAYADGGYYKGDMRDGKRDGDGVYLYPDYGIYTGQWKDGRKEGNGTYQWPDGSIYRGEWRNGSMHGAGILVFADGGIFRGTWVDGSARDEPSPRGASSVDAQRDVDDREALCEMTRTVSEARKAIAQHVTGYEETQGAAGTEPVITRAIELPCR